MHVVRQAVTFVRRRYLANPMNNRTENENRREEQRANPQQIVFLIILVHQIINQLALAITDFINRFRSQTSPPCAIRKVKGVSYSDVHSRHIIH